MTRLKDRKGDTAEISGQAHRREDGFAAISYYKPQRTQRRLGASEVNPHFNRKGREDKIAAIQGQAQRAQSQTESNRVMFKAQWLPALPEKDFFESRLLAEGTK
jgi:hypothetical protein